MEGDTTYKLKNFTGVPNAKFVENVEEFMSQPEHIDCVDKVLKEFDELHGRYRMMEGTLSAKRRRLRQQVPDLTKSIEMIEKLQSQKDEKEMQFSISEQVYLKAFVKPRNTVYLWLGANVMVEYELEDALTLLKSNIETAYKTLEDLENDLDHLRDQTTTTEVNMARIYNWDVKRRRANKSS